VLKLTAIIATLAVACLLLAVLLNGPENLIGALFIAAATAMAVLLFLAYLLIAPLTGSWIQIKRSIFTHIVLHAVLASYVALQFLMATTLLINTIYLLPIVLFFYTGRRTWAGLFDLFGRKMYRIYYFGNTALMQTIPILLALGFLVDESIGTDGFRQATVGYFGIHCLITGLTLVSMEKDILSQKQARFAK
jgi:hypothetical protein